MAGGSHDRPIAVYGAIVANFIIAVTKFVAAFFTGSSAMISEGIHSLVDTGNQGLLLLGLRQARKPADAAHPFGHGQELYFWGLIVAIILFGLGGGLSIYEGISHIQHPVESGNPLWNYAVLGIAFVVEGSSFYIATREFLKRTDREQGIWQALRASKDPSIFVVLMEDAAAMVGLLIAFLGVLFAQLLRMPILDGVASLLIGLMLSAVAVFLAYESKGLLVGEAMSAEDVKLIVALAEAEPFVESAGRPLTMYLGPKEVLLALVVHFEPGLSSDELAAAIDRMESSIGEAFPEIKHIFIEAEQVARSQPAAAAVEGASV